MRKSVFFATVILSGLVLKAQAGIYYLDLKQTAVIVCRNEGLFPDSEDVGATKVCGPSCLGNQVNRWQEKNPDKEITKLERVYQPYRCGFYHGTNFYKGVWITYHKVKKKK